MYRCRILILTATLLLFGSTVVHGLAVRPTVTRRVAIFGGVTAAATTLTTVGTLLFPSSAFAYERRDVGDETRSAEQAAYNLQAYETNNRLERQGLKLETQAEQKASLTAALADYAYAPTTTSKTTPASGKNTRSSGSSDNNNNNKAAK